MKAIIIAAGMGARLSPLTNNKPKCLLELNGKTLLQHQVEALKAGGIDKIVLIKGYKKEMIHYPDLTYCINDNFQNNDILHSLLCAEKEMDDEFIAVYSDILYSKEIVKSLIDSQADIAIAVDAKWRQRYQDRKAHPIEEAENVLFDCDNNVIRIGKDFLDKDAANGEFIGMMKCSKKGTKIFTEHFCKLKQVYSGRPFQKAPVFEKAYLTDMVQDLVDSDIPVFCVPVNSDWMEIDTVEDYENIVERFSGQNFIVK